MGLFSHALAAEAALMMLLLHDKVRVAASRRLTVPNALHDELGPRRNDATRRHDPRLGLVVGGRHKAVIGRLSDCPRDAVE